MKNPCLQPAAGDRTIIYKFVFLIKYPMRTFTLCLFSGWFSIASNAQIQWVQSTWGNQLFDFAVDKNGNCYLTGANGGTTFQNFTTPLGGAYFVKYSSSGQVLCASGSTGAEDIVGERIVADNNGNMYAAGEFDFQVPQLDSPFAIGSLSIPVSDSGGSKIYFVKLDNNANAVWLKSIGGSNNTFVS